VSRLSIQCGILNISQPNKHPRPVKGIAFFHRLVEVPAIVNSYRMDDRGVGIPVPTGVKVVSSPNRPDQFWDLPCLISNGYRGLSPGEGVKLPGRVADHSPPTSAVVKDGGSVPPLPYTSSWPNKQE
jgi:hypothetical protein